jgi:hypothetical protein
MTTSNNVNFGFGGGSHNKSLNKRKLSKEK